MGLPRASPVNPPKQAQAATDGATMRVYLAPKRHPGKTLGTHFVFLKIFVKSSSGRRFPKNLKFCGQLLQKFKINTIGEVGILERKGVNPIHFYGTS